MNGEEILKKMQALAKKHKKDPEKIGYAKWHIEDFENYVSGKMYGKKGEKITRLDAHDFISYDMYATEGENGIGPFVITNPEMGDWHRYDNIIDYYSYPSMTTTVKPILDGAGQPAQIYPYCAFVHRKTGVKGKESVNQSDRWSITNMYFDKKYKKTRGKDWKWKVFKKNFGVSNIVEWQRDIVPQPPYIIYLFCEATNFFKNPLTLYRLKPMIISYWC